MDLMVYLLLLVGIVLLMIGAEVMVRGAEQIALGFGISPLVVGLTVVAFGTSAPELAVGIRSALLDQADIALGNVVGSNILNILLILGLSAMITPMVVESRIIRREIPILLFVSFLLFALALDGTIASIEGVILFAGSVVYTVYAIRKSRKEASESTTVEERESPLKAMAFVLVGLGMLVFGAELLVDNAVILARWFGVSELLIGLTIVSIGTSLPEIATSVVAAMRGMRDMAVGNVIGSCLFNVLAVSGATAIFASGGLSVDPGLLQFDLPVMLAATVACLPIFATGHVISRWEGCVFFVYYLAYTTYLLLFSHGSESVEVMNWAMLSFVLPLTFVTLAILWYRDLKA